MNGLQQNDVAGITMIAFIIAVAVSAGFYQFIYVPGAGMKPTFSKDVIEPEQITEISIAAGAASENNGLYYVPDDKRAVLGVSNKVVWHNEDSIAHTVTSDNGHRDAYSGLFDSRERSEVDGGPNISPGTDFVFIFTTIEEYRYHCEPHPHMAGTIEVVEDTS